MAGPEDWGAVPTESNEGPAAWGAKPTVEQPDFPPGEPTFTDEFMHGFTSTPRGIGQMVGINPAKAKGAGGKVPREEPDNLSPGAILGQVAQPMNWVAPGVSMFTKMGTLARGAIAGGVSGLMQPVKEGESFLETKAQQGVAGLALGYGFSIGGKAASAGVSAVGEWLMAKHPDVLHNKAVGIVLDKIAQNRYGMTANDAIDLVRAANKGMSRGKNARMMTLSDLKELNKLAGTAYRKSDTGHNMARDLWEERDKNAGNRLRAEVAKHIHGGETMFEAAEALLTARSAAAAPLYEKTDQLQGIWSPYLNKLFQLGEIKEGMKLGFESERIRAAAADKPFNPTAMGVDISDPNNILFLRVPNMRVLDMAKRGLDEMIAKERNEFTGRLSSRGLDLELLRKGYLGELDKLDKTGTYKAAREAWAGPSRSLDAMVEGRAIFEAKPEETAALVAKMSKSEKEFFLTGVADVVTEKIMNTRMSSDEAKAIVNSNWAKQQLRQAFDNDKDFNRFMGSVAVESDMFNSMRNIGAGSQTAGRLAADADPMDVMDPSIRLATKAFSGKLFGASLDALRMAWEFGTIRHQKEMADEVAKILFTPLSPTAARARSVLEIRPHPESELKPAARAIDKATPFVASGAAGGAVPQEQTGDMVEP